MEKILMGRGKGKTTKLVGLSHKNNIPIVTYDRNSSDFIKKKFQNLVQYCGLPTPMGLIELDMSDKIRAKEVYVDNADIIFKNLFEEKYNVKLAGYSMTLEDDDCWSNTPDTDLKNTLNRLIPIYEKAITDKDFNVSYQILKNIEKVKELVNKVNNAE